MNLVQSIVKRLLIFILEIFFRENEGLNVDKIPTNDPVIFVCAPHANQFLDPIMVIRNCGRNVGFLAAAVSMKRKFVGRVAKAMNSIPVARPQDLAKKGNGTISGEGTTITGTGTEFTKTIEVESTITSNGQSVIVTQIVSDTELKVKDPGLKESLLDASYKVIPKVDQSDVYEAVFDVLKRGDCIGIFPEGGSHDRTELLPLKAGFTVMALGAKSKYPELNLKIVPVGLVYFRAHAFRSTAYVDFGEPISISAELCEKYQQGGPSKREACAELLEKVDKGLKTVTVSAPDYETLQMFQAARRLYKPNGLKLSPEEKLELNRAFAQGYSKFKDEPAIKKYREKYLAYKTELRQLGIQDHQVKRIKGGNRCYRFGLLIWRFFGFLILLTLALPGLILTLPATLTAIHISSKKAKAAKAASSVKIAGRDVLATWKIFIGLGFIPILWILYTIGVILVIIFASGILPLWARIVVPILSFFFIPFIFYASIIFVERGQRIFLSLSPLFFSCFNRTLGKELKHKREELQTELRELVETLGPKMWPDFDQRRIIQKDQFPQQFFSNPLHSQSAEFKQEFESSDGQETQLLEVKTE